MHIHAHLIIGSRILHQNIRWSFVSTEWCRFVKPKFYLIFPATWINALKVSYIGNKRLPVLLMIECYCWYWDQCQAAIYNVNLLRTAGTNKNQLLRSMCSSMFGNATEPCNVSTLKILWLAMRDNDHLFFKSLSNRISTHTPWRPVRFLSQYISVHVSPLCV